jgi:acyl carrier protein
VNRQEIERRVVRIITEQFQVPEEKIKPESVIALNSGADTDLCADSLDTVELMMDLEDEFDFDIHEEEFTNLKTVKSIVDYVESHM